jgi:asparagine synthase (glutamine-hydrolysing)
MLDVDYLMRFDCYAKLRSALVMEHWARVWQSRLAQMQSLRSLPDVALTI